MIFSVKIWSIKHFHFWLISFLCEIFIVLFAKKVKVYSSTGKINIHQHSSKVTFSLLANILNALALAFCCSLVRLCGWFKLGHTRVTNLWQKQKKSSRNTVLCSVWQLNVADAVHHHSFQSARHTAVDIATMRKMPWRNKQLKTQF